MFDCEIQFHLKFHTNGLKVELTTLRADLLSKIYSVSNFLFFHRSSLMSNVSLAHVFQFSLEKKGESRIDPCILDRL